MAAVPQRFAFDFAPRYRSFSRVFGVTEDRAWLEVGEEQLKARFGRWRISTPLTNITELEFTGPYRYFKTAGPARLAFTDRGLTFASNGQRGLRIGFRDKITGLDPFGVIKHPELTVTVVDLQGLAELLRERTGVIPTGA